MQKKISVFSLFIKLFQGILVGVGAILPGISGGILSVIFGIYQPAMETLAHPRLLWKKHFPVLFPALLGVIIGFFGLADLLSVLLTRYPHASVCAFVGLIMGMLPSLLRDAGKKGVPKAAERTLLLTVFGGLLFFCALKALSCTIAPSFTAFLFCGFTLALSFIAPGMSFSALLMPLDLYTPFIDGIGRLNPSVILPGGIGALLTFLFLPRLVNGLLQKHYAVTCHGIIGIVIAATVATVPYESFCYSVKGFLGNSLLLILGAALSFFLDELQHKRL